MRVMIRSYAYGFIYVHLRVTLLYPPTLHALLAVPIMVVCVIISNIG